MRERPWPASGAREDGQRLPGVLKHQQAPAPAVVVVPAITVHGHVHQVARPGQQALRVW
jgi:hypothetical protein